MHDIGDERLLNLTEFVLDFLPKKPLKEQETVLNDYGVWVISGVIANKSTCIPLVVSAVANYWRNYILNETSFYFPEATCKFGNNV